MRERKTLFESGNLFADIPEYLPEELFSVLARGNNVRVERIVSRGQTSPTTGWYEQPENEWVAVLQGAAELLFANHQIIKLRPGDYINIPAHTRHRVQWTTPDIDTVWLAVFYV